MGKLMVKKPHAVCIPYPAQSHITTMLKFAKLLNLKGFHITFVHTEYNYSRTLKSRGPNSLDGTPDFRFESIPDGLPPAENDIDATQDIFQLCLSTDMNCHAPFLQLLKNLNHKAAIDDFSSPVTCVISDCVMPFTLQACEELGIPNAQIWTINAVSAMCMLHVPRLAQLGYAPLKDMSYLSNGYLDQTIDWIPGVKSIRLSDMPVLWTVDAVFMDYMISILPRTLKGSALIINTFDSLESEILKNYSTMVDHLYTIGPIHTLLKEIQGENHVISTTTESIQSNLWKEDDSVIEWLNSKEKGSVAYLNFGSIAVLSEDQLVEFAWGLSNSLKNFLWIIRPDLVTGGSEMLPPEFLKLTKDRGMLSTWCNQELVLNHPSVGVFLTHCGWNSVLESLCAAVPLICWPFFGDQITNCLYSCSYWGVGMDIDRNVDRVEVEKVVLEMMEGDKGMEMKKKALEWKKKAEEAITPDVGSSYTNLDKLIQEVLLKPKTKSFV